MRALRWILLVLAVAAAATLRAPVAISAPAPEESCCVEGDCCCAVEEPSCCAPDACDPAAPAFAPSCGCGGHGEGSLHVRGPERWIGRAETRPVPPRTGRRAARGGERRPASRRAEPETPPPRP